jgi:hypothetical protein
LSAISSACALSTWATQDFQRIAGRRAILENDARAGIHKARHAIGAAVDDRLIAPVDFGPEFGQGVTALWLGFFAHKGVGLNFFLALFVVTDAAQRGLRRFIALLRLLRNPRPPDGSRFRQGLREGFAVLGLPDLQRFELHGALASVQGQFDLGDEPALAFGIAAQLPTLRIQRKPERYAFFFVLLAQRIAARFLFLPACLFPVLLLLLEARGKSFARCRTGGFLRLAVRIA